MLEFLKDLFNFERRCPECGSDKVRLVEEPRNPYIVYCRAPDPKFILVCDACGYGKARVIKNSDLNRNSFVDNVFRDKVVPRPGSVLLCDLSPAPLLHQIGLGAEHTGIYIGENTIIHRDGSGRIEKASPDKFLNRLDGLNCAISVYTACRDLEPFASERACERAIAALDDPERQGYDLLNKNCHHFTRYCLTGDTDQWGFDFTFASLQNLLKNKFLVNNWRVWDYDGA